MSSRLRSVLVVAAAMTAAAGANVASAAPAVPAKYRALLGAVDSHLGAYAHAIGAMPQAPRKRTVRLPIAGVDLLAANGNRLSALLQPAAIQLVDLSLDRFRALGVGGVTLGIKVPMLLSSFSPDAQRYADFYATVARHIRARKMAVSVELGALFCGTVFAGCTNPFAGSYRKFVDDAAAQARIVIKRLHPDYLTLISEPDTEAKLSRVAVLDTPAGAARAVSDILARIGPRGRTLVGSGSGTWLPTSFAKAIAAKRIDYLDTHIYPVGGGPGANAVAIAAIARRAHKPLVAGEVWLYKSATPGVAGSAAAGEQVASQDMYSFWGPLDARFLSTTASWARKGNAVYVSAFWSWQFFAYETWTPALDVGPYARLSATFAQSLSTAFAKHSTTTAGQQWSRDLRGVRSH
jgi:hypothetical protein